MHIRAVCLVCAALLALGGGCRTIPGPHPSGADAAPWYEAEIRAFETADRASPPPRNAVLFIGSSSIRMWNSLPTDMQPIPVLNRGFGGSKTADVLAVYDRVVRPYAPRIIIYYCGDNDHGTDNTDSTGVAEGFFTFVRRVHHDTPGTRIFYIAIKPSIARWKNWAAMQRTNAAVRAYCERTPAVTYLDTATPTLTSEGRPDPTLFMPDGLHLNDKGYAVWTQVIRPALLMAWRDPPS